MSALFRVHGPFKVPLVKGKKVHYIEPGCPNFWNHPGTARFAQERGCYLFVIRAAKGFRPVYVGKTKHSFANECFASHKVSHHYSPAIANTVKGTLVVFLIVLDRVKGPANSRAISQVEAFLIQNAVVKNPNLSHIHGTKEEKWGIVGVIRGGKGKTPASVKSFRAAMGI